MPAQPLSSRCHPLGSSRTLLSSKASLSHPSTCIAGAVPEKSPLFFDTVFVTTNADGDRFLHMGLSPDRKTHKSAGLHAGAPERTNDPTCPIRNLKVYLQACERCGLDLTDGHRLAPEVTTGPDGDPTVRRSRASHNSKCEHTYSTHPDHRVDDCHPPCQEWAFPAVTVPAANEWLHELCVAAEVDTRCNVHALRSAPVLIMLGNGTSVADINALMGWAPNSRICQVHARTVQFHSVNVSRSIDVQQIRNAMTSAAQSRPILPLFQV